MRTRHGQFPLFSFLPSLRRPFRTFPRLYEQHVWTSYHRRIWSNLRRLSRLCDIISLSLADQPLRLDSRTHSSHNLRVHRNFECNRPCRFWCGRKYCSHGACGRFSGWSFLNFVVWAKETWDRRTMKVGWRDILSGVRALKPWKYLCSIFCLH